MTRFGYDVIGGSNSLNQDSEKHGSTYQAADVEFFDTIVAYLVSADPGPKSMCAVYDDDVGDALVEQSSEEDIPAAAAWVSHTFAVGFNSVAGKNYILCTNSNVWYRHYYDFSAGWNHIIRTDAYGDGFEDPCGIDDTREWKQSIYLEPGGAAPAGSIPDGHAIIPHCRSIPGHG